MGLPVVFSLLSNRSLGRLNAVLSEISLRTISVDQVMNTPLGTRTELVVGGLRDEEIFFDVFRKSKSQSYLRIFTMTEGNRILADLLWLRGFSQNHDSSPRRLAFVCPESTRKMFDLAKFGTFGFCALGKDGLLYDIDFEEGRKIILCSSNESDFKRIKKSSGTLYDFDLYKEIPTRRCMGNYSRLVTKTASC
jgi:hypothetical protein